MEYRYCENRNWEDFSSGRVLYGTGGVPNFPVRLANEMYRRALACVQADGGRQQEEGILRLLLRRRIFTDRSGVDEPG